MRKIIRTLAFWLLKITETPQNVDKEIKYDTLCTISKSDRFLFACMPNGEIIPGQLNLRLSDTYKNRGFCKCEITILIPIENVIVK